MAVSTIVKIVLYLTIGQCILSTSTFAIPLLEGDRRNEAFVVGGSIVVFTTSVSTQAREDVRNGILSAQLLLTRKSIVRTMLTSGI